MPTETTDTETHAAAEETADDERVRALEVAYAQGDFAHLRKRAREIMDDASLPESVRESARSFQERLSVDVAVYGMLAFAFALFCAIVMRYALP